MRLRISVFAATGFLLAACNFSPNVTIEPKVQVNQPPGTGSNVTVFPLSCTAALPASYTGLIPANQVAPIEVSAVGGVGPYKILGMPGTFTSATSVSRSYGNNTSTNKIVDDTVQVIDAGGLTAQCAFQVTVQPSTNPQPFACTIEATPTSPVVNQDVFLIATGRFGTAPYSYHSLNVGTNGSLVSQPSQLSSTQIAATVKYAAAGLKTVSIQVRDAQNNLVSCSAAVTVRSTPSISAVASPSATVNVGSSMLITASSQNFLTVPQYTFTGSGVTITPTANNSIVLVTSSAAVSNRSISISAVSTDGESATTSIPVTFLGAASATCTVSHVSGSYAVGTPVTFNVVSSTGEAVVITEFIAGTNGTVSSSTNTSRTVSYSTSGTKVAQVKASTVSGVLCNAGSYLTDSVTIDTAMTCNASSSPSTSYSGYYDYYGYYNSGTTFLLSSTVSGASSVPYLDSIRVKQNGSTLGTLTNSNGALSTYMYMNVSGSYVLELTVKDAAGRSAICSTTQVVRDFCTFNPYYCY